MEYIKTGIHNTFPGRAEWIPERDIECYEEDANKPRVIFVTGGDSGIGKETIIQILSYANKYNNIKLYLGARNPQKAQEAIKDIQAESLHTPIFHELDLGDLNKVVLSAKEFSNRESRLDCLILNAGVMTPPMESVTAQNYDLQFGVNVIGHFVWFQWMVPLLLNGFHLSSEPSRVAWLSSAASIFQGKTPIDYDSIVDGPERRKLSPTRLYFQSKLGDVFLSNAVADKYGPAKGIISVSIDPGNIRTNLYRSSPLGSVAIGLFKYLLLFPVYYGALSSTFFATIPTPHAINLNGKFLTPWTRVDPPNPQALVKDNYIKLWDFCTKLTSDFLPPSDNNTNLKS